MGIWDIYAVDLPLELHVLPRPSPCAPHATAPGVGPKRFWTDDDGWEIPEMMGKS